MQREEHPNFEEFEKILNERLVQTEENIAQLKAEIDGVCSEDDINDVEDLASLNILSQKDNTLLQQQENELREIEHALAKIKNGTYGLCEKSFEPIPLERLRANPIARTIADIED